MKYSELGKGIVKRTERRSLGLFIDGTGLDRATRRINRKVDLTALVRGVTSGLTPTVARYYTLIPYEDDSRQRAFLDAVARAGVKVIVKRLPPKGINRQVSVDVEMGADIVAFSLGHSQFSDLSEYKSDTGFGSDGAHDSGIARPNGMFPNGGGPQVKMRLQRATTPDEGASGEAATQPTPKAEPAILTPGQRIVTVVCPSRDLAYSLALSKELGVDTVNADFGQFTGGDVLKSAAKWIDLSDSETIWRE